MSSNTASTTSFFSFGPNDSFVSKSAAGLQYLQDQLLSRAVSEVHWAVLGPSPESWVLSSKDSAGKSSLKWGPAVPSRLQTVLNKTWHSPHLRAFLGPDDSFLVWHPDLIRWGNLPTALEDALQSWLTPSGWRVGPPRMVTWGPEGAFFAMSEYGDVVFKLGEGDAWEIYKETVDEWKAEKGFQWNQLAYIALDPSSADQFIAVRKDGTWAGSIDDVNEDALEGFALNFFAKAKTKHRAKQSTSQPGAGQPQNGTHESEEKRREAATKALYEKWSAETASMFAAAAAAASAGPKQKTPRKIQVRSQSTSSDTPPPLHRLPSSSPKLFTMFPYLPGSLTTCALPACKMLKLEENSIHACHHDVEKLLRASGLYSYEWLRQERLRWHPDRFGRLCAEEWRETGKRLAGEMFKLMSVLMEDLKGDAGQGGSRGS
ncbi:hypothetical protein COCC4DRAFT_63722 [Bipolaris maydis ATCC 48331]|uniref:Uncharacterized protein n=2 Tax=Cochliobolus heterostrophus TaxID=5016 RepID=M2UJN0_COCH5|nr:uncharacterized protein COCC4DRAFT_63722 [Bipolaris maydis ATCC 48331]EMD88162.1 hypothetical protein COCHEDRAFT_1183570 [Bipolaris maydis C5]KAJ5024407.1 hypothetical protein J3E73DRAFT_425352 [Bipolaris maydis]ENI02259.1 hypothetical protein COCC4DRAFT_63722 [Bipolaris maydis ATCC 48331]KAJ5057816.1 hypothetical protein J3E74DRAFT_276959 [Bipolaris maydis]KAJ6207130.1 hypothetical protein PSV09DRAFT_1183570 [Bipolaris maydis]